MYFRFSLLISFFLTSTFSKATQTSSKDSWTPTTEKSIKAEGKRTLFTTEAKYFFLNLSKLKAEFLQAPVERPGDLKTYGRPISLPLPDGSFQTFHFASYEMMEPGLKANWPEVHTFTGQGLEDRSATVKVDFTPYGFRAQIIRESGSVYIDPLYFGATEGYAVYEKSKLDLARMGKYFRCELSGDDITGGDLNKSGSGQNNVQVALGDVRRVYRAAVAATGEYTSFHGGLNQAAAAITTTLNRVNGVYEREICSRLILVANNNQLIYTNASTDPYTNNNGLTMLGQNQTNVTNLIGTNNYDIGHVFSTGGGGVAGFGVVCNNSQKARGVTGSDSPVGDPFDIDYVAHEMGHQFGGSHTFNSQTGSCGGGNREATSAYEPGSGTTIMAYAGICGSDNVQNNSNDYFNFRSLDQISGFITTGTGNTCPVKTNTGNAIPQVSNPTGGFIIPISTPFRLVSNQATDADGDALTYCWEQSDLGPAGGPNNPSGNAPIFRSFSPVSSRERLLPRLQNILSGTGTMGEILPSYARNLTFRVTVRDNKAGGGGTNGANISLTVNATGGAFSVTTANTSGTTYEGGSTQTITWNRGGTAAAPFNVSHVRIRFSSDGGQTFPIILADSTANDGSEAVTLPVIVSNTCRVMVEAIGNIFFDINNANFRLTAPTTANIPTTVTDTTLCAGQTFSATITPTGTTYNSDNIFRLQLSDANGQFTNPTTIGSVNAAGDTVISATLPTSLVGGTGYKMRVVSTSPVRTSSTTINAPRIKGLPGLPGAIIGFNTFCEGDSNVRYEVPAMANTSSFEWTLPQGISILSNPDSNVVFLQFSNLGGTISVKGINSCGVGPAAALNVQPRVILPAQITASAAATTICEGSPVSLTSNPTNGGSDPTFQWLLNGSPIQGATNSAYSTSTLTTGDRFSVVLTSSLTCGTPNVDTSNVVIVTVTPRRTPLASIESNALNDTTCTGEPVTFTSSINTAGGNNPQYAWFRNTTQITGQTTNTLQISNLVSGDSIRMRLTVAGTCLTTNQVFSPARKITVMALTVNAGPDTTICQNTPVNLFGQPAGGNWTGTGITPQGSFSSANPGNITVNYNVNKYGCFRSDARIISVVAPGNVSYTVDGNTLNTVATGVIAYQWFLNGNPIAGANSAAYTITESGEYCVEVQFSSGCKNKSQCSQQVFTSIQSLIGGDQGLKIIPNPANQTESFTFLIQEKISTLSFFNNLGQEVKSFNGLENQTELKLHAGILAKGVYHIKGQSASGKVIIGKLIIQ